MMRLLVNKIKSKFFKEETNLFLLQKLQNLVSVIGNKKLADKIVKNCFFAGGCIRNLRTKEPIKDFDIFFKSEEIANEILRDLIFYIPGMNFMFESKHTVSFRVNGEVYQFCKPPYCGDPDVVVGRFDYTNCMAYYDFYSNKLVETEAFKDALTNKKLVFNVDAYNPEIAIDRCVNFTTVGWDDSSLDYKDIVHSVAKTKRRRSSSGDSTGRGSFD